MIVTFVNWGLSIGLGAWLKSQPITDWIAIIPFGVLLLFVAPYKLWKRHEDKLHELTTPRLRLEILQSDPEINEREIWWHLAVHNDSLEPIEGCYAKVKSFEPNTNKRPYEATHLPWASGGGTETRTTTIPGECSESVDVVMADRKTRMLYIPIPSAEARKREKKYPEPPGSYEIEIQVGSEKQTFKSSSIRLTIELKETGELYVKEVERNEATANPFNR